MVMGVIPASLGGLINRRKINKNIINFYGCDSPDNVLVAADILSLAGSVCIVDCTRERKFALTYFDSSSRYKSIQLRDITICEESVFKGEHYFTSVIYVNGYNAIKRENSTINYVMCEVDMSMARRCAALMNDVEQDFVIIFKRDVNDERAVDVMVSLMDSERGTRIKQLHRVPLSEDEMQCAVKMKVYGVIEYGKLTKESMRILKDMCKTVGISELSFARYVRANI